LLPVKIQPATASRSWQARTVWEGVLKPVVARYRGKLSRIYFRADAGFANPEVYEYLEGEGIKFAIRLPRNNVLQERIGYLLTRPVWLAILTKFFVSTEELGRSVGDLRMVPEVAFRHNIDAELRHAGSLVEPAHLAQT
jgi:hypothetical protein